MQNHLARFAKLSGVLQLTANIVTGIMLGFATLVIGRLVSGEIKQLNVGTIIITVALVAFYAFGLAI